MKVFAIIGIILLILLAILFFIILGMVFGVAAMFMAMNDSPVRFAEMVCRDPKFSNETFPGLKGSIIELGRIISENYLLPVEVKESSIEVEEVKPKKVHKRLAEDKNKNDNVSKGRKSKNKR